MTYIATFFSHFGAIRYKKLCDAQGFAAKTMPVPRTLSSSCGTCVRCEGGFVELTDVQLEGSRRMPAADMLKGRAVKKGDILGR